MEPSLSLVIATYNRLPSLVALLEKLPQQSLAPDLYEVVVVDDGSTPPVEPQLRQLAMPFAMSILTQENQGQAAARQAGVENARGEIIVIVDDDMELPVHFLEAHLEAHRNGLDVVLGHIRPHGRLAQLPLFERFHAAQLDAFVRDMRRGQPARGVHVCTGNLSFRRADFQAIGGFDPKLRRSEDRELGIRFEKAGKKLGFSEKAYSTHQSDHADIEVWLKRAFNYGYYDSLISHKHRDMEIADPWRFLFLVHPVSRPLLLLSASAPRIGEALSDAVMRVSEEVDKRGGEGWALRGVTLTYGLRYFAGMRAEAGNLRRCLGGLHRYLAKRRYVKENP